MITLNTMDLVLKVNNRQIKDEELLPILAQHLMLPQLAKEMVIDQAIEGITCTPEEKNAAHQYFLTENKIQSEEQLQSWLKLQGIKPEHLESLTLRKLKIEKFKQQTWENQLENYFIKRKRDLDQVIYSLIRTKDTGIAQEIYFRIQEQEESFSELASKYSQGIEAQTGGIIGPVELSIPHPTIAQILSTSEPGQLIPPTRVGEWLVIIRLEKLIRAQLDKALQKRLLDELFQQWLNEQLNTNVSFFSLSEQVTKTEME